jgi:mono/diheme cytochrome c family protein
VSYRRPFDSARYASFAQGDKGRATCGGFKRENELGARTEEPMRILKALFAIVVVLFVVALVAAGAIWFRAEQIIGARVQLQPLVFSAAGGDATRGAHFANAITGCTGCHGQNLAGGPFITSAAMAILYAPNLTKGAGGIGDRYSDVDFERAIRHGIRPDGSKLFIMPSTAFQYLSDHDLRDVIAFVRSSPSIANATKPRTLGPIAHVLIALGKVSFPADRIDQTATPPATQPPAVDVAYGSYVAHIGGCFSCHGPNLAGGHYEGPPDAPAAANITPAAIGSWTLADFKQTIKTGRDPNKHVLNPFMPWREYAHMSDDEFNALYAFVRSVPPVGMSH